MASQPSAKIIDLRELTTEVAKVELSALNAGVECWQVWITQIAKFTNIAGDVLQAIQDDKASLSDTVHRLTAFGKENTGVVRELASRLSERYFDELDHLTSAIDSKGERSTGSLKPKGRAKKVTRRAAPNRGARPNT